MTPEQQHALQYNDQLQDWLDGDVDPAEAAGLEAHLADCVLCQEQLARFESLDESLRAAVAPATLDHSFDERLFAQIDSIDEQQRAAARARIEQEMQESMLALSRSWRRMLAFVAPGVIAGVALAFALAGYFFSADFSTQMTQELIEGAGAGGSFGVVHLLLTTLLGAGVGGGVASWLARVAAE
ncbi:MAG TPA: zf-HC2 domain-containing protein [Steroidobacter sp.]|jgi:anti-sigma factor RsiW|nr:zf-HC2 domain-containing protein [Steroidobacteraceae bacterium]HLS80926.1 zf-HC2 domain-containing protein [Steroidobacter sp.]